MAVWRSSARAFSWNVEAAGGVNLDVLRNRNFDYDAFRCTHHKSVYMQIHVNNEAFRSLNRIKWSWAQSLDHDAFRCMVSEYECDAFRCIHSVNLRHLSHLSKRRTHWNSWVIITTRSGAHAEHLKCHSWMLWWWGIQGHLGHNCEAFRCTHLTDTEGCPCLEIKHTFMVFRWIPLVRD